MGKIKIVLLSGGSGIRLWPLSNGVRTKQFLKLLKSPTGESESMFQRVLRQIQTSNMEAEIFIVASNTQKDSLISQSKNDKNLIIEPERRDTFPAIVLASSYLLWERKCSLDDIVIVMPIDSYTEQSYFTCLKRIANIVSKSISNLTLMGVKPKYPSTKFGYIIPKKASVDEFGVTMVEKMIEKPSEIEAKEMISQGAFWNAGVFAFKLSYIKEIIGQFTSVQSYDEICSCYSGLKKISFDYEVVEKEKSLAVVPFDGEWQDLGTWNAISNELQSDTYGNVSLCDSQGTSVINELDLPVICAGLKDLIVVASPDGILVSDKLSSENLKRYINLSGSRPMYEERRWGSYKVMGFNRHGDGVKSLTKMLCFNDGGFISYQRHKFRDEIWIVIEGSGLLVVDGIFSKVTQGNVITIKAGDMHAIKSLKKLQIIEVQVGTDLDENDIERFELDWCRSTII